VKPTEDASARRFLFVLLIASLLLVGAVAWPLASALLLAAVLAVVLDPLQRRLASRLRGRAGLASGILVVAVVVVVVGPLIWASAFMVKEASAGLRFIYDTVRSEGSAGLIDRIPAPLNDLARRGLAELGDATEFLREHVTEQGPRAAGAVATALAATGSLAFQLAMMLIALFFLLARGRALVAWVVDSVPLRPRQTQELFSDFRKVARAVIVSTLITAAVQAAAALAGYLIARVPHPFFFALVTFFVALIPAIGAAAVCLFAALILLVTGHPYMAIFLAAWGIVVVGLIDNVVKPYLIKDDVDMGGAVVFFALVGGIAAFGIVGLLIGPLAVAAFLSLLRMYRRDFGPREG
jgi:predicted PurR-regulated permease PerM